MASAGANESPQILKARRKLQKQIDAENSKITAHALQRMAKTIEFWLDRHKRERVKLKDKSITLFDENRHPAKTQSKFVNHLLKNLQQEITPKPLEGRIKI
jgi:hypothetical protein